MRMNRREISEWKRNRNVRVWRRALYEVYSEGPLSLSSISEVLGSDPAGTERQLKKMRIDYWVVRKNHKWHITDTGLRKVESDQKYGSMPILYLGNNY